MTPAEELSSSTSFSTRSKRGFYPTQGEICQHESLEVTPLITCRGNVTLFAPSHQTCYKPARDSHQKSGYMNLKCGRRRTCSGAGSMCFIVDQVQETSNQRASGFAAAASNNACPYQFMCGTFLYWIFIYSVKYQKVATNKRWHLLVYLRDSREKNVELLL